jgi:hypothetical protein
MPWRTIKTFSGNRFNIWIGLKKRPAHDILTA